MKATTTARYEEFELLEKLPSRKAEPRCEITVKLGEINRRYRQTVIFDGLDDMTVLSGTTCHLAGRWPSYTVIVFSDSEASLNQAVGKALEEINLTQSEVDFQTLGARLKALR